MLWLLLPFVAIGCLATKLPMPLRIERHLVRFSAVCAVAAVFLWLHRQSARLIGTPVLVFKSVPAVKVTALAADVFAWSNRVRQT